MKKIVTIVMSLLILGAFSAQVVFADQGTVSQEAQKVKQDKKQLRQDKKDLRAAKKAKWAAKRAAKKQQTPATTPTPAPAPTNQ